MNIKGLNRKGLVFAAIAATAALTLSGCSASGSGGADTKVIHVGISEFVQAPPLDAAIDGFKEALAEAGYVEGENIEYDVQNANAEVPTATTIAQKFANDNLDLVLAVATPSAQAAAQNITNIPVLFTAVTDPVAAGIVASDKEPGANVTGTSDMSPVAEQIALIKEINPNAKTVGVVYSSGEVNSEVQVKLAKEAAAANGMTLVEQTVTSANDLQQATEALGNVDAIWTPGDNLVISGLSSIIGVAQQKGILVVGADSEHVKGGAVATVGVDYKKLGYQTGQMAVKILKDGANPATMPVETQKDYETTVSLVSAKALGVTVPETLLNRATVIKE